MESALELFGNNGYQSTSISQIAKAAGVSKGLLYNYFDSKEDLLQQLVLQHVEENEAWWNDIVAKQDTAYEQVVAMVDKSIEIVQKDLHKWQMLTSLAFQPHVLEGIADIVAEKQGKLIGETIDIFRRLGVAQPEAETFLIGAILDGMFLHYLNMPGQYPLTMMRDYILARYEDYKPNQLN
ncbi:MAG: TetR/AcrR family transcriptional regulator [Lewinella sp.]|nr:TetR/AcrR family transcriptional regulator [Lewinella sp.]